MDPESGQWLAKAEEDFRIAKHLLETFYPMPYEHICFHCQQAAEKAIKAVIVFHNSPGGLPKKHDLSFLLQQIRHIERISDTLLDYADELTPYSVSVRYPNELFLTEQHSRKALIQAKAFLDWAQNILAFK